MVGFDALAITSLACLARLVIDFIASSLPRFSSNSEMSAPDTNALSPAPASTMTRTAGSASKSAMIFGIACHMSNDTALRFSGWLKIIQPMPPSLRAIILGVPMSMFMRHLQISGLRRDRACSLSRQTDDAGKHRAFRAGQLVDNGKVVCRGHNHAFRLHPGPAPGAHDAQGSGG